MILDTAFGKLDTHNEVISSRLLGRENNARVQRGYITLHSQMSFADKRILA